MLEWQELVQQADAGLCVGGQASLPAHYGSDVVCCAVLCCGVLQDKLQQTEGTLKEIVSQLDAAHRCVTVALCDCPTHRPECILTGLQAFLHAQPATALTCMHVLQTICCVALCVLLSHGRRIAEQQSDHDALSAQHAELQQSLAVSHAAHLALQQHHTAQMEAWQVERQEVEQQHKQQLETLQKVGATPANHTAQPGFKAAIDDLHSSSTTAHAWCLCDCRSCHRHQLQQQPWLSPTGKSVCAAVVFGDTRTVLPRQTAACLLGQASTTPQKLFQLLLHADALHALCLSRCIVMLVCVCPTTGRARRCACCTTRSWGAQARWRLNSPRPPQPLTRCVCGFGWWCGMSPLQPDLKTAK